MRKLIYLFLSVAVAAGAVMAAPPKQGPTGKLAAELSKPSDFKKPFRPLVPTRSRSLSGNSIPNLFGALENPMTAAKSSKPKARTASSRSVELTPGLKLRGSVLASANFMSFVPGVYDVPTTSDGSFELVTSNFVAEYGAYDDGDGHYYVAGLIDYGMGFTIPELYVYSTETWEQTDYLDCDFTILGVDNATDPTTGKVYGCYYDENYGNLAWAEADYPSGTSRTIKVLGEGEKMFGVACDGNGQYYAVLENGNFVKVDKETGEYVVVGDTGLRPYYATGATFDVKSNTFIFCYSPAAGTGSMWGIDPTTGTATIIYDFPDNEEVTALMALSPEAEPLAPAAPAISVTAAMGSMTASYQITMPSTLFNGDTPDGFLKWTLMVDGTVVKSEEGASYGVDVYGTYTLETKGSHTFSAYVENEVGRSPIAKQIIIVGSGVPKAPVNVKANTDGNGSVWLNWDVVTEAADGGYVNPDEITYTVSRDGKVLSEGKTDTYFEETVEIPETYSKLIYEVRAVYAGTESEAATAEIGVGFITPPYACKFSAEPYDTNLYTVINSNNDNVAWYFSPYYGCFKYDYSDLAADDWLISPAFQLEAGKIYEFSFSIAAGSTKYTERYEVAMGMAATAGAMITELIPETELTGDLTTPTIKTITIKPTTTGNYYFGWHAVSDAAMFMIQVKDIKVSAAMVATSPAEASKLVLTPDADGHLKLHGSFNAPAVDISGNPLASLGKVVVTRDGKEEPVAQFESVSADKALTFDDNDIPEMGTYTYSVTAWDSDGNIGRTVSASTYVGPVAPENVPAVYVKETETLGEVIVKWDAPTFNVDGAPLKDENLTYMVYVADADGMATELLDEPTATREARFTVCQPDEKKFALFYVKAFNLGLESLDFTRSPMTPVGKAEALPYSQGFNDADRAAHLLGYVVPTTGAYGEVTIGNAASTSVAAQDGDDAFIKIYCSSPNSAVEFFTGKIDLSGAANPAVSIYHYVWSNADTNTFSVYATSTDGAICEIGKINHADGYSEGWNLARFPLDAVKGEVVKITVSAEVVSHENMLFDNLRVADLHNTDLAATSVAVPSRIEPGKEFPVKVTIANLGLNDCAEYKVDLMLNGEIVETVTGHDIKAGTEGTVDFKQTLTPLHDKAEYTAAVTVVGDEDDTNNVSPMAAIELVVSKFPAVNDLEANRTDGGVSLSWSAPSTVGFDIKPVEDFEDAKAWTEEVENWTMVDRDGQQIGSLDGAGLPDAVGMRTRHSFFIFDNESEDIFFYNPELTNLVKGHSGSKTLVAMYTLSFEVDQDDWAISPLLNGSAQTVSFYARSYHPDYLDRMEVLYSTTDSTNPDDFVSLCADGAFEVPQKTDAVGNADYTNYEFDLPDGALRFALRAHNPGGNGFMLMIDDVKLEVANATLQVVSYDIYRDGVKINAAPVTEPSYTDAEADGSAHSYRVVVNYNRGISPASNIAEVALGVGSAIAESLGVSVENRTIVISCVAADEVMNIYTVDGRTIYSGTGSARIAVSAGTYIVDAGSEVFKLLVP